MAFLAVASLPVFAFSVNLKWGFWFFLCGLVLFWAIYLGYLREGRRSTFEVMLTMPVLIAGATYHYTRPWLNLLLIPLFVIYVFETGFQKLFRTNMRQVLLLTLMLPVINGGWFLVPKADPNYFGTAAVTGPFLSAVVMTFLLALFVNILQGEKEELRMQLSGIRDGVKEDSLDSAIDDEAVMTRYLYTQRKTDEEILAILHAAKESFFSDSTSFFEKDSHGGMKLRCTTDASGTIMLTNGGMLLSALNNEEDMIACDIRSQKLDPGYIKKDEFDSIAIACVKDGNFSRGLLVVDSDRYHAFPQTDIIRLRVFADAISLILERSRLFSSVNREHEILKSLTEESKTLVSTLEIKDLSEIIVGWLHRVCREPVLFLLRNEGEDTFKAVTSYDIPIPEKNEFRLDNTILNIPVVNYERNHREYERKRQKSLWEPKPEAEIFYHGDLSIYSGKTKILPFKYGNVSSILCIPLAIEGKVLGMIVSVSCRKNAFSLQQNYYDMQILKVFINMASMAVDNALVHRKIALMSKTDGLTKLFNRRHFQEQLDVEIRRSRRNKAPLSVVLTDIDFFKKVNDTYGHPAGDAVLRSVADILRSRVRETDIAARYGGEEFAVILTNTDSLGAKHFAEELRLAIQKDAFHVEGQDITVTLSLGIASIPAEATSKEDLIDRADQSLYFAKENGRNRVVRWSEVRK